MRPSLLVWPLRCFLLFAFFSAAILPSAQAATTAVYIAQIAAGAMNGTDCGDAYAVSFFNTASNWTPSPGAEIGPGTTVHLCGTFTGMAGGTMLTFQGSGTNGNPITLFFEPNAVLTAPYWAGNPQGAIYLNGNSYITIDGGANGQINATANGTNLANRNSTYGIQLGNGSNNIVQNMNIVNLYQRAGNLCDGNGVNNCLDGSTIQAIQGGGADDIIQNNLIHDVGWGIACCGDNTIIRNNEIYHADHGAAPNAAHWYFYGNHLHDWDVWDDNGSEWCGPTGCNAFHHDGVHCYGGGTSVAYVYNNRFDGASGGNMNQPIFLEGGDSPTRCFVNGGISYIFNNISILSNASNFGGPPEGGSAINDTNNGDLMANNLEISGYNGTPTPQGLVLQNIPNSNCPTCGVSLLNNAVSSFGNGITAEDSPHDTVDYNAYEHCSSIAGCWIGGTCNGCGSLATWQSGTLAAGAPYDAHGIANPTAAENAYFLLNPACTLGSVGANCAPQAGSPLIGAGKNLFNVCNGQPNPGLGALCYDINGNPRPAAPGAWDIGAYQFSGNTSPPPSPPPPPPPPPPSNTRTFYIAANGSDSYDGTEKTHTTGSTGPWLHAPGMPNCSGTCNSTAPQPGDGYIFRGGDTWTAADLGVIWSASGASAKPIYIGVDTTWYSGSAWARPIWTCGGVACASGTTGRGDMFDDFGNWVILDNIELTGFNTATDGVMVQIYGSNVTVENVYAHGWNHNGEAGDSASVFSASTNEGGGVNVVFHHDIADGSDTTGDMMACFFSGATSVYDSVCRNVSNGLEGAFDTIHDNWIGPINFCFPASGCHQNAIQQAGPYSSTENVLVYNNVITGVASGGMGHLWVEQGSVNDGALNTYVFGNVMFNNQPGNDVDICQEGNNCGTHYFFNNTFECGTDANRDNCAPVSAGGSGPAMVVHFGNNHWIDSSGGGLISGAGNMAGGSYTETTDLAQTVAQAAAQGYLSTSGFAFQPPASGSGSTLGTGTNEQSLCTTIAGFDTSAGAACREDTGYACFYETSNHTVNCPARTPVTRPSSGAWDIGAYQNCPPGECVPPPPPPPPSGDPPPPPTSGGNPPPVTTAPSATFSVQVYPNPWRADKHAGNPITFAGLVNGTTIKIFTVSGHKVKEASTNGPTWTWDRTNNSGDTVASGIYVYAVTDLRGDKARGKVAIIK